MEKNITIGTTINFKRPIDIVETQQYVNFLEDYSRIFIDEKNKLEKFMMPASNDQPLDMPMAIIQFGNNFTASVSRGKITVQGTIETGSNPANDIAKHLSDRLAKIISSSTLFQTDRIRAISCTLSQKISVHSLSNLRAIIRKTPYNTLENDITDYGFNLEMFTTPIIPNTTSQSFSYVTLFDEKNKQCILQMMSTILIGGINFSTRQYVSPIENQIKEFIKSLTKENISKLLRKLYAE